MTIFKSRSSLMLLTFLAISCTPQETKKRTPIKEATTKQFMVPELIKDQALDTSLISSVQLIALQTDESSILKKIDGLKVGEKYIYILDKEQESVFIFDKDGKFRNKIEKQGRGPEEYYYIVDFSVNEDKDIIEIYDQKKLISYNLEGNFLNAISVPFFANNFVATDSGYIFFADNFCNDNFCDNVIFCDNAMEIVSTGLPIPDNFKNIKHSESSRLIQTDDGKIRLVGYDDAIYTLSDSGVIHRGKVIVNGSATPASFYEQQFTSINDYVIKFLENPNAGFIGDYKESDHYLTFTMHKDKFTYTYIYNKATGMKLSFRKFDSQLLNRSVMDIHDERLFSFLEPTKLTEIQNDPSKLNDFDRGILERNRKILSSVDMSDNPILISYKVK